MAPRALIEPTPEEARNGWTAEALTAYHAERERAQSEVILHRKPAKPVRAMNQYRPAYRWSA